MGFKITVGFGLFAVDFKTQTVVVVAPAVVIAVVVITPAVVVAIVAVVVVVAPVVVIAVVVVGALVVALVAVARAVAAVSVAFQFTAKARLPSKLARNFSTNNFL